ncbi:Acetylornithine deacetylase/Succinyl-diaminopimelate desuccinylase or related deacylase [Halanaeroarchaeum sp. HSR-CO]|uniref:[LysW]-lysine hydrolase n=1 Tax=Halanaeroarchaeum sp. HSR-CO TaxID=2866382 RepID=UPI00217E914E|nr:[LysW]-lysine hydrolase [Halanaeroarchaeum sp. HSR-CO]UWG49119.1 Acetylornithine deacetylase/Succinyl-diaminopimelate desuccinylase or related deacylase [Halanaeroarchaeum sp. HSR-CO]
MDDARTLLTDLVSTPSVSGGESEAARILVEAFERAGREVWIDEVGNVRAPADDSVLLTSHIDTVPGEVPVREEDGFLWGRGSVDATGPLAAMAVAAVETGVSFVGVVEEETTSRGARHLVETRDAPDAVVNGEPSGWAGIVLGYRGYHAGSYRVEVPSAHTAVDDQNAIERAMDWWDRVEAAVGDETARDATAFERATAKPVGIEGGVTEDGLATEALVDAQFRLPPGTTGTDVESTVDAVTESGAVAWDEPIPPVMRSPRNAVARALRAGIRAADGEPTHLRKTGTSDMNLFAEAWDVPMATYGPGDSSLDHAPDERLELAEFDRSVAVLTHATAALAE